MKKLNKSNCFFLYGDDPVSANIRKNRIIDSYFHGKAPEVTLFDGSGTFEAYQNALEGQSLFTAETAVVLHNPPFLKRRSEKEDHREESFLETVKDLSPDILLIILWMVSPINERKSLKPSFPSAAARNTV